jgi:hypothetical protein
LVRDYDKLMMHLTEFEYRMAKDPLKEKALKATNKGKKQKRSFTRKCFTCGKVGYKNTECQSTEKKASTGPLAISGGYQGLSLPLKNPKLLKAKSKPKDWVNSTIEAY